MRKKFDVLIIGTGISALSAAIVAGEAGLKVALISKEKEINICNSEQAQGGIVAQSAQDSPEKLIFDILRAGDFINYKEAVKFLAYKGVPIIKPFLSEKIGVPFCVNCEGKFDYTYEGAHSKRRILHIKDKSGQEIERALIKYLSNIANILIFSNHTVIELISNTKHSTNYEEKYKEKQVIGAYILDNEQQIVSVVFSKNTILATGGVGDLFTFTSNLEGAVGDGLTMAKRIGAEIINAEYVQFHPTIIFHKDIKRFLISEALRGEGAQLVNRRGEYFMKRYSPELKDLAPRDEVSRAIYREIEADAIGYVWLDARNIKNIDVTERFPRIFNECFKVGIDIRKDLIPVVPAAHYFCGGIKVDLNGYTGIKGLWAIGECSCTGVHGANRLASVSLLEAVVWAINSALDIIKNKNMTDKTREKLYDTIPEWEFSSQEKKVDPILIYQDISMIRKIMWNYCGIIRTKKRLLRALADLSYLRHRIKKFYYSAKLNRKVIELNNAVSSAIIIVTAALENKQSYGCHYLKHE